MPAPVAALLLADGRFPNGSHAHSGCMEEAVNQGLVSDLGSLRAFLVGRVRTAGLLAAALAAASCWICRDQLTLYNEVIPDDFIVQSSDWTLHTLAVLDQEADARMCSPAQRRTSRRLGHQLLRVSRRAWPCPIMEGLAELEPGPHQGVVLGAVAGAAGLSPVDAAVCAAYDAAAGPGNAAVRLLGLDPLAVAGLLAELGPLLDRVAALAAAALPAGSSGIRR